MNKERLIFFSMLFLITASSCNGNARKAKQEMIEKRIMEMKATATKADSTKNEPAENSKIPNAKEVLEEVKAKIKSAKARPGDQVVGIWEAETDYYKALYEIERYRDQYVGKIHYYSDGENELTGKNSKDDYFIEGVRFENGEYSSGKIYMPDGSNCPVQLKLEGDKMKVSYTLKGERIEETWNRKKPD